MDWKTKKRAYSIIVFTLALGFLLFIASPGFSWQTKDPKLAEDYAKMLGFKSKDMVGKVAPEIKPGVVVDSSNYKNYPGLAELLPKCLYGRLDPKAYAPLAPIKIKETDQYHLGRGWMQKTMESAKTIKIGGDGLTLEGHVGGYPFLHPKNGVELVQWCAFPYLGDTLGMRPLRIILYNRENRHERELRQNVNFFRYKYCTDWRAEGIVNNPEDILYVVSGTFIYPRDISGTSYVRKRFLPAEKADEFLLFVASMRRIRRMSGRDTQDPLFGSDLVWDDYNIYWQKLSTNQFPNDYKMGAPREMLLPTYLDYNWPQDRFLAGYDDYKGEETDAQTYLHFGSWQRRWVYPLEIISKDGAYCYGKRIIMCDPESCVALQTEMYDQSGRLWREWVKDYNLTQDGVGIMEDYNDIVDHINTHRTILDFKGEKNARWIGPEYADVRFLSRSVK